MANSKRKGAKNERGVSHLFAEWTGYEFARTPQSGGLHWQKKITTGDIVCIDEKHMSEFALSIECKFHEDLDFSHLIDGTIGKGTNKVLHFWNQCITDAKKVRKVPCLFMRRNGMKADTHFVAIPTELYTLLSLGHPEYGSKYGVVSYFSNTMKIAILNSEDFFDLDYEYFHIVAQAYRVNHVVKKLVKRHGK